jgi:hypothetical protein
MRSVPRAAWFEVTAALVREPDRLIALAGEAFRRLAS